MPGTPSGGVNLLSKESPHLATRHPILEVIMHLKLFDVSGTAGGTKAYRDSILAENREEAEVIFAKFYEHLGKVIVDKIKDCDLLCCICTPPRGWKTEL